LELFAKTWRKNKNVRDAIDEVVGQFEEDFSLSQSTSYSYLRLLIKVLRLNHLSLGIHPPDGHLRALFENLSPTKLTFIFNPTVFWQPARQMIAAPP
jgi:hypothetical protein